MRRGDVPRSSAQAAVTRMQQHHEYVSLCRQGGVQGFGDGNVLLRCAVFASRVSGEEE